MEEEYLQKFWNNDGKGKSVLNFGLGRLTWSRLWISVDQ